MIAIVRHAAVFAILTGLAFARDPCSSESYSRIGKCGGAEHNFLRCPQGYWCSQYGYCGTTAEYRQNALCPQEQRDDPSEIQFEFSPDDKVSDYEPQDDTEGELYDSAQSIPINCYDGPMHRFGKCGTAAHGHMRCKYGEWCSAEGYCGKFAGAAKGALCKKEVRPNPTNITYARAPDDDPYYIPQTMSSTTPSSLEAV